MWAKIWCPLTQVLIRHPKVVPTKESHTDNDSGNDLGNDSEYKDSKSESESEIDKFISADEIIDMNHKALRLSIKKWSPDKKFKNGEADTFQKLLSLFFQISSSST